MGQNKISFSSEKWTPDSEVVTRMGVPVRILATDINNDPYSVVGVILRKDDDIPACWSKSGLYNVGRTSFNDLFIKV